MAGSTRHSRVSIALPLIIATLTAARSVGVPTQTPAPAQYGVQAFGPAGAPSGAIDISELGNPIVGHVRSSSGAERAAVWSFNGYRELGTLGGAQSTALGTSYSIVVGQAQTASGQFHAFRADIAMAGTPQLVDLG